MADIEKGWVVTMSDELYTSLPKQLRDAFDSEKVFYKDYDLYKEDAQFKRLYKEKREANEKLEAWKFDRRHGKI